MMPIVILGVVFLIVFIVSNRALAESASFGRSTSRVLAGCVAMLSVLGLLRFAPSNSAGAAKTDTVIEPLLLPYAALALSVIIVLVLSLLWRWFRPRRERASGPTPETATDRSWGGVPEGHRDGFVRAIRRWGERS